MIITNLETIPNKEIIDHYGVVFGSSVRAKHAGRDIMAGFKNFFGGEIKGYTELLNDSRNQALQRAVEQAQKSGANAIVNVRFATSAVAHGAAEVFVYGTAVKI